MKVIGSRSRPQDQKAYQSNGSINCELQSVIALDVFAAWRVYISHTRSE